MARKIALDIVGRTPLVGLERITSDSTSNLIAKLEIYNPSGSIKDRVVEHMLTCAEYRGEVSPGDTLIEATTGNMGIALALASLKKRYHTVLVIPPDVPKEMRSTMTAFGAELISVSESSGMETARGLVRELEQQGVGKVLDQFSSQDNPDIHYRTTGPELWNDSEGSLTHFVCCMGTTGTIVGVGKYLKEKAPNIQVIGVRPIQGAAILGLQNWSMGWEPQISDPSIVDDIIEVTPELSEETAYRMISEEGLFVGISSGAAIAAALRLCRRLDNATVATIIYDCGDRYISTGIFN